MEPAFPTSPPPAPGLHPNPGSTQGRVPHSSPPCRPGQGSSGREPAEMKSKQNCERRRTAGALTQEKNFSSRQLGGAETSWGPGQAGRGAGQGGDSEAGGTWGTPSSSWLKRPNVHSRCGATAGVGVGWVGGRAPGRGQCWRGQQTSLTVRNPQQGFGCAPGRGC